VTGAEQWQYAQSLDAVTKEQRSLYLDSDGNATDVFRSGSLRDTLRDGRADSYVYDPRDTAIAALEEKLDPASLTDQSLTLANGGKLLVYHSEPFAQDTEVSGFFGLTAWIALDQPDTDFSVAIFEIRPDGSSILLTRDLQRARYREGPRQSVLINTREPLKYQFDGFTFVARRISRGSRLRLVLGPVNSIYAQKNHNSGKDVANESIADSRPVNVKLFHDAAHPSALRVPIGG
jgi:putative CocE/NonD family hydrolase